MSMKYKTGEASLYLTKRGRRISKSRLEKFRQRGPEDPRDRGPDFYRDPNGTCWYDEEALDRYAAAHVATLKFRATAPRPQNFRRDEADQAT
jgi:hypothetical protein